LCWRRSEVPGKVRRGHRQRLRRFPSRIAADRRVRSARMLALACAPCRARRPRLARSCHMTRDMTRNTTRDTSRDWFPKRTIGSLLDERAKRDGAREALVFEGYRSSFAELARDVDAVARGLIGLGIEPGDKVSLWMVNRPEWIHAALAVLRIGAALVPINTRFRSEDAAYVLRQSDSTTLIIAARSGPIDYLGIVRALLPSLGAHADVVDASHLPAWQRVTLCSESPPSGPLDS